MEFSRQEYWSGLLFPSPGGLPHPGIELAPPASQGCSLRIGPQWSLAADERAVPKLSVEMRDNPGIALRGKGSPDGTERSQQLPT